MPMMMDVPSSLAVNGLLSMLVSIVFIVISWWSLQAFKFDLFMRNNGQAKLLQLLLAVAIGYSVTRFFLDYLQWTQALRFLF